jgi:thymidine kinase
MDVFAIGRLQTLVQKISSEVSQIVCDNPHDNTIDRDPWKKYNTLKYPSMSKEQAAIHMDTYLNPTNPSENHGNVKTLNDIIDYQQKILSISKVSTVGFLDGSMFSGKSSTLGILAAFLQHENILLVGHWSDTVRMKKSGIDGIIPHPIHPTLCGTGPLVTHNEYANSKRNETCSPTMLLVSSLYHLTFRNIVANKVRFIIVDEGHFFMDGSLEWLIMMCRLNGIQILVAGLTTNFHGTLFPRMATIKYQANWRVEMRSICSFCREIDNCFSMMCKADQYEDLMSISSSSSSSSQSSDDDVDREGFFEGKNEISEKKGEDTIVVGGSDLYRPACHSCFLARNNDFIARYWVEM